MERSIKSCRKFNLFYIISMLLKFKHLIVGQLSRFNDTLAIFLHYGQELSSQISASNWNRTRIRNSLS